MISILYKNKKQIIKPTKFPDGTSQVWKLDLDDYKYNSVKVIWDFEEESELIWINQLICLLYQEKIEIEELYIPYLPYGRQDKDVSNDLTFAREVFLEILLKEHVGKLSTLDAHSEHPAIHSYKPFDYIDDSIVDFSDTPHSPYDVVLVFPDAGAYDRYYNTYKDGWQTIVLDKVRDQKTGWITSLKLDESRTTFKTDERRGIRHFRPVTYKFLIIDDIADGGATFIRASKFLHEHYKCAVGLYVTHGIYSKGFEEMIDSGISKFYTTQSLIKNIDGYVLEEIN